MPDDGTASAFIFRKQGEFWMITYAGDTCYLPDSRGLVYLTALLRRPHTPIHATVLRALGRGAPADAASADVDPAASERARVNVTRAIKIVLRRIAARLPALGVHLGCNVHTGRICTYTPDRGDPISWDHP